MKFLRWFMSNFCKNTPWTQVCMIAPLTVSCLLSTLGTIHMYKYARMLDPVVAKKDGMVQCYMHF